MIHVINREFLSLQQASAAAGRILRGECAAVAEETISAPEVHLL